MIILYPNEIFHQYFIYIYVVPLLYFYSKSKKIKEYQKTLLSSGNLWIYYCFYVIPLDSHRNIACPSRSMITYCDCPSLKKPLHRSIALTSITSRAPIDRRFLNHFQNLSRPPPIVHKQAWTSFHHIHAQSSVQPAHRILPLQSQQIYSSF